MPFVYHLRIDFAGSTAGISIRRVAAWPKSS